MKTSFEICIPTIFIDKKCNVGFNKSKIADLPPIAPIESAIESGPPIESAIGAIGGFTSDQSKVCSIHKLSKKSKIKRFYRGSSEKPSTQKPRENHALPV